MGSFHAKYIMFDLKKYRRAIFHDTKKYVKFEEKLTYGLENDMWILAKSHQSTQKCQNWHFIGVLLSEVENTSPKNLKRNYV